MYLPKHFEEKDRGRILDLIRANPLATLVRVHEGSPVIDHLPMILDPERRDGNLLIGHLSKRNPSAATIRDGEPVKVVFQGPHAYITPKWYAQNDVPTWNYAVVHGAGRIRKVAEAMPLIAILRKLTEAFEGQESDPWKFFLPEDLRSEADLTSAILGFEIEIDSWEAKFKLSQNRSEADRAGVIDGLKNRPDEMSRLVLEAMLSK